MATHLACLGGLPGPRVDLVDWDTADREETGRLEGISFSGTGGGRAECDHEDEGVCFGCWGCWPFLTLSAKSPIFALLNVIGMRLTRISMRVLSPCAWRLYCARSLRARSETVGRVSVMIVSSLRRFANTQRQREKPRTFKLEVLDQGLFLSQWNSRPLLLPRAVLFRSTARHRIGVLAGDILRVWVGCQSILICASLCTTKGRHGVDYSQSNVLHKLSRTCGGEIARRLGFLEIKRFCDGAYDWGATPKAVCM